jgi:hypothetical protein
MPKVSPQGGLNFGTPRYVKLKSGLEGVVLRNSWRKILRFNMVYYINGQLVNIRDAIDVVKYASSKITPAEYITILYFSELVPKNYM